MSSRNTIGKERWVGEQSYNEDAEYEVEESPELRATVELEVQAKVDTNHPDARPEGTTLEAEERMRAREWELDRMNSRSDFRQESSREARTRRVAARGSNERRREFSTRAASVDPECEPGRADPRERLSQSELADVNQEAARLAGAVDGWTRAAIARRLAEELDKGASMMTASIRMFERAKTAPGTVIPIGALEEVRRKEVSISGRVTQLWDASSPAISQVGLIEDETGRTKVTVWERSDQPAMAEGERVRIHKAARNWYQGRCSVALTSWSEVFFPERGRWWEK